MSSLGNLLDDMLSDERVIGVIGKDKQGRTKLIFKGTVLDAWRARKIALKHWQYRDVLDIEPATIKLADGRREKGLKITVYAEYGFEH